MCLDARRNGRPDARTAALAGDRWAAEDQHHQGDRRRDPGGTPEAEAGGSQVEFGLAIPSTSRAYCGQGPPDDP